MRNVRFAALSASLLMAIAGSGIAGAAEAPIVLSFEKDCPILTCEETASSPVDVETVVTPVKLSGLVFHYTAIETFSSASGSVTVSLTGILNLAQDPNTTVLHGTVLEGTWNGVDLDGAQVWAEATRLYGTTFGGTVRILPASAG